MLFNFVKLSCVSARVLGGTLVKARTGVCALFVFSDNKESTGNWQIKLSASGYSGFTASLGGLGYLPVLGDFNGGRLCGKIYHLRLAGDRFHGQGGGANAVGFWRADHDAFRKPPGRALSFGRPQEISN